MSHRESVREHKNDLNTSQVHMHKSVFIQCPGLFYFLSGCN